MKEDEKAEDGEEDDKYNQEEDAANMTDSDWALWQKQDRQLFETAFLLWKCIVILHHVVY